jgi:predicted thioredoxin/glutaredoxin
MEKKNNLNKMGNTIENKMMKLQFKYLDYLFEGMYEVNSDEVADYLRDVYENDIRIWIKDKQPVLKSELQIGFIRKLWVLNTYWDDISNMLSLDNRETKELMREWAEKRLELKGKVYPQPRIISFLSQ